MEFSPTEFNRYSRHFSIPEFNIEGQKKLKSAKVLVVGAGGLGCPVLLYLSAAGVGTIGIVDHDTIDESNLQRQVLYNTSDIGKPKVEIAKQKILSLNPHIQVKIFQTKLTSQNALEIMKDFDIIVDGSDNFPTRYLVNDACVILKKPNVYGSVFRFEGQVSVFNYKNTDGTYGPHYRSLYPSPPPADLNPNCAEGGVLGVLPGMIGSLQVNEVIKLITGIGQPLSGKLVLFDALSSTFRILQIKEKPEPVTDLIDYENFCKTHHNTNIKEITVQDLKNKLDRKEKIQIIDVREKFEHDIVNLGGELIPLSEIKKNPETLRSVIQTIDPVIIHCKRGSRSAEAIQLMQKNFGLTNLYNLKGGILAYVQEINPTLCRY